MSLVWSGPEETWQKWLVRLQSSLSNGGDRRDLTQGWEGRTRGAVSKYDAWARMDPEFRTIFIIVSEVFFFPFCSHRKKPKTMLLCWIFPVPGAALYVWKMTLYAMYLASK